MEDRGDLRLRETFPMQEADDLAVELIEGRQRGMKACTGLGRCTRVVKGQLVAQTLLQGRPPSIMGTRSITDERWRPTAS